MLSYAHKRNHLPAAQQPVAAGAEAARWPGRGGGWPRGFLEGLAVLCLWGAPPSSSNWLRVKAATPAGSAAEEARARGPKAAVVEALVLPGFLTTKAAAKAQRLACPSASRPRGGGKPSARPPPTKPSDSAGPGWKAPTFRGRRVETKGCPRKGPSNGAGEGERGRLLGKCRIAEGERRAISGEWRGAAPEEALIGKEARQIRG